MALLFLDSFDHYSDASDKYLSGGTSLTPAGRHGQGSTGSLRLALSPGSSRCIIGAALNLGSPFNEVYHLYDSPGGLTKLIGTVSTMNDGSIDVTVFGGDSLRSAVDVVRLSQWHYIEVDLTVAIVAGSPARYELPAVTVSVDGTVVLTGALGSGDADATDASVHGWGIIDIFPNALATIDDLYVCDGSGVAPHNAPLGDVQIDVIRPNGVGAATAWTASGAETNWGAVRDPVPDDDATRVIAATAGLSDLYTLEDINTNDGILGAQLLINARRTEEGFATLTPLLRHAGTTTALQPRNLSPTYFYRNRDVFVTMPNGDPLTDANVNALQAGMRRDA